MSGQIDTAYIEILPDLKNFDKQAVKELKSTLKDVGNQLDKAVQQMSSVLEKSAADAGKAMGEALGEGGTSGADAFTKDATGRLRNSRGQFVKLGEEIGESIGEGLTRDINGRLRDSRGKFVKESTGLGDATGGGFFSGLKNKISGVGDFITKSLSTVAPALGVAGVSMGGTLVATLAPIVISGLAAAATVGGALLAGTAIIGIGALALKENQKLVDEAKSTVDTLKKVFASAAEPLVAPFSDALKEVRKVVTGLAPDLKTLFAGVAPSVRALTAALGPTLAGVMDGLKKSLPGINAAFAGLSEVLPKIGKSVGNFFATIFKDSAVIKKLTKDFGDFIAWILDIAAPAFRVLTVLFSAFVNVTKMVGDGIALAWKDAMAAFDGGSGALQRIAEAWRPLKVAIYEVWDALKLFAAADTAEERAATFRVLVEKIKEAWGPLKGFLSQVWDEAWAAVKRAWDEKVVPWWEGTAKPWLTNQVKSFVVGVFSSMVSEAVSYLASLPGRAAGALAGLGGSIRGAVFSAVAGAAGWLWGAGSSIVSGLVSGILSRIGEVANAASRLGQIIRDNKGPESYDRVMLRPAGRLIVQGLQAGMADEEMPLQYQMQGLTKKISSAPIAQEAMDAAGGSDGGGVRVWPGQQAAESTTNLVIQSDGSKLADLLVEVLSKAVRVRGGNVQKVLGTTAGGVA